MASISVKGSTPVRPPSVVLPKDDELADVARKALGSLADLAAVNRRAVFTPEELRAAVENMPPHRVYEVFCVVRDGTVPRTPLDPASDIGKRLKVELLKVVDELDPQPAKR